MTNDSEVEPRDPEAQTETTVGGNRHSKPDPVTRELLDGERDYIQAWRKARYGDDSAENIAGLALSGGGIRSATFSLGVMQALAHRGLLRRFDYLSTVSGGGYIGSAITWLVSDYATECDRKSHARQGGDQVPAFGLNEDNFPFGSDDPAPDATRSDSDSQTGMLSYLRQHGNYLSPGGGINLFSMVGVVLRGMLLNLLVWIPLLIVLYQILFAVPALFTEHETEPTTLISQLVNRVTGDYPCPTASPDDSDGNSSAQEAVCARGDDHVPRTITVLQSRNLAMFNGILWISVGVVGLLLLVTWLSSPFTWLRRGRTRQAQGSWYTLRRTTEKTVAKALPLLIVLLMIGTLPVAATALDNWAQAGPLAVISGAAVLIRGFVKSFSEGIALPAGFVVTVAALLFLYGVILVAFQVAYLEFPAGSDAFVASILLAMFALFTGWFVNVNYISVHRFYRDRLMETFMPDISDALRNETGEAKAADSATLQDLCRPDSPRGPYHIVNTNVVLVDSRTERYKLRGGDNFILSPLFCGSNATGITPTEHFMGGKMTLATAVAISGAAANPNAGVGGQGLTRNRFLSLVMSLLNIKLGYWADNPQKKQKHGPNHLVPGAYSLGNVLGLPKMGFNEHRGFVLLSDGGHFENTGVYELIRRRVKLILVCDGGADAEFSFSDFQTTVRRIEDDFGARISVVDDASPDQTVPKKVGGLDYPMDGKFSQQGHMLANIEYADGSTGTLIYLKTTLMKGVSFKVKGYAAQNPDFPDQSTSDQFFDEVQFEAYRELGYRIAANMLESRFPNNDPSPYAGKPLKDVIGTIQA